MITAISVLGIHVDARAAFAVGRLDKAGRAGFQAPAPGPLDGQLHLVGEVAVLAVHADLVIVFYIHGFLQNSGNKKGPRNRGP